MKKIIKLIPLFFKYLIAIFPIIVGFLCGLIVGMVDWVGRLVWAAIVEGYTIGKG